MTNKLLEKMKIKIKKKMKYLFTRTGGRSRGLGKETTGSPGNKGIEEGLEMGSRRSIFFNLTGQPLVG